MCAPETDLQAILDNELCCLRHGVYNLGFLAVRRHGQGRQFVAWWADRLRRFCYDEVSNGLFTDQRWVDLAPAFFDDIAIVRDPQYNVATWNLTHRRATGRAPYEIQVNGRPLVFYHFSGFDSGAQKDMLDRYGSDSPVLFELRDWYIARCEELGQSTLSRIDCVYNRSGTADRITDAPSTPLPAAAGPHARVPGSVRRRTMRVDRTSTGIDRTVTRLIGPRYSS